MLELTIDQIADKRGISYQVARLRLKKLQEAGKAKVVRTQKMWLGQGRPSRVYRIHHKSLASI